MNRDDSAEEKTGKSPIKEVPTSTDVDQGKRVQITKFARRFERYGLVQDGQQLVALVADIAGGLDGKSISEVPERHRKKAEG